MDFVFGDLRQKKYKYVTKYEEKVFRLGWRAKRLQRSPDTTDTTAGRSDLVKTEIYNVNSLLINFYLQFLVVINQKKQLLSAFKELSIAFFFFDVEKENLKCLYFQL